MNTPNKKMEPTLPVKADEDQPQQVRSKAVTHEPITVQEELEMSVVQPSTRRVSNHEHSLDDECVNGNFHNRARHFQEIIKLRLLKIQADLLSKSTPPNTQTESFFAQIVRAKQTPDDTPEEDDVEKWRKHPISKLANVSVSQNQEKKAKFAQVWSAIIFIVHTYIFFTCCFYLGIEGFPQGMWLLIEVVFELIIVADTIIRLVVRLKCPSIWKNMALLHETTSAWHLVKVCVATVPQSLILMHALDYSQLSSLYVAFSRCVKLVHIQQLNTYFQVLDLTFRRAAKKNNYMKSAQILYFTCLFVHFVTCAWCFTGRVDPQRDKAGWLRMDGIMEADGKLIKDFQWTMYLDSFFFCHAQMGGIGFGNVVPSTNLEWVVVSVIEVLGASIYFGLYSDIAVEVYRSYQSVILNKKKAEDAQRFAKIYNLPGKVTDKITSYYQNLRLKFVDFDKKHALLHEFSTQLQDELVLAFNSELIQNVKFFQMADPAFIVKMALYLSPQICNAGTFVFLMDEAADKMYFIHKGKVDILAADNKTVIAKQQQGQYFGEIGCLLTNKRSLSVKSNTTSILFYIEKQPLLDLLQEFPKQGEFLKAVGHQRLQSTKIQRAEKSDKNLERFLDEDLFGKQSPPKNSEIIDLKKKEDQELGEDQNDYELEIKTRDFSQGKKRCSQFWLTPKFKGINYFIIIPLSAFFYLWNIVLSAAMTYYIFFIPFNIGTHQDMSLVCNIVGICVLILDMPMRAYTAVKDHKTMCLDRTEVLKYYLDHWLALDLMATIPFELLLTTLVEKQFIRWIMLLRLLKCTRLQELSQIIKNQSHMNGSLGTLIQLGFYFFVSSHFISCGFCLVGSYDYANKTRFNKMTLFGNFSGNSGYIQEPIEELTPLGLYGQMWYFAADIIANVSYGDSVPFADFETAFSILSIFWGRVLIAFIAAESASYLASVCDHVQAQSIKMSVTADWTKRSKFPASLVQRLKKFHKLEWEDSQGTNVNEILDDMPETLKVEIRTEMLQSLNGKWEVLENDQFGLQTALTKRSKIVLYPPNECIYRESETAQEIFFIIWGKCEVHANNGDVVLSLGQGQHFGYDFEDSKVGMRGNTVKASEKVQLAVIKMEDFLEICRFYPTFLEQLKKIEKLRKNKVFKGFFPVISNKLKDAISQKEAAPDAEAEDQSQISFPIKNLKRLNTDLEEKKLRCSTAVSVEQKPIIGFLPEFQSQQNQDTNRITSLKEYFDSKRSQTQRCAQTRSFFTFKIFMSFLNQAVGFYNIVFVPLQFAFRIEFNDALMALQIFTKVFYFVDIVIRGLMIRKEIRSSETKVEDIQTRDAAGIDKLQFKTSAQLQAYINHQIYEIVTSFFAMLPLALVISHFQINEPWYVIIALKSVCLCKFRTIFSAFSKLRTINSTVFRIIEVMCYYYIITHYWTCVMIASAAYVPDCNQTWLRKVPYPQYGPREPDFFKDTSAWTAYVNGVYFLVSSYSHVNIGDITAISFMEKCATPFINIGGLFMYYLLYSNITLITANFDFASAQRMKTEQKLNQIKNKMKISSKIPDHVLKHVTDYIEFNISLYDGWEAKDFLSNIPNSIKQDLMFSRFQEAIEDSLLFKKPDLTLDIPLVTSVFKAMTQQTYLKNEYILKLGSQTKDFIIVLEGEVNVYGMFENKWLGFFGSGAHYWNELRSLQQGQNSFKTDELTLQLDETDNLDSHSLLQLTAKTVVVVGILKQEQMEVLCEIYPAWKEKLQDLNRCWFELGKKSVVKEASSLGKALERGVIIELLQNAYTFSTTAHYNTIVDLEQKEQLENFYQNDLLQIMKASYVSVNQEMIEACNQSRDKEKLGNERFNYVVGHPKALWYYRRFYIIRNSTWYRACEYLSFLNLLYIAIMLPLRIGFQFKMDTVFISIESASLLLSFISFLVQLRVTVVDEKKQKTLQMKKVLKYYWDNGFMVDFFGFSPLNLILDIYLLTKDVETQNETMVIVAMFLRLLRVISAWKMIAIQDRFFNDYKIPEMARNVMKTTLFFTILSHFTVCAWGFLLFVVEKDEPKNWLIVMNLKDTPLPELYLRCFYAVMNIVTTTGSGDVYACTDLERIFFFCMITAGDVLFSLAFGFIASMAMLQTVQNDSNTFIEKVIQTEKYMDEHKMTQHQKKKVGEFYAYVFVQKTVLTTLDKDLLYEKFSFNLVREIFYYSFKEQVEKVFGQFGSDNLIKELICRLTGKIFLPDDFVLETDKFGQEMFFVCDGILVQRDGQTTYKITKQYGPGDFFGENGILMKYKPSYSVQAQTFCLLNELTKSDFDDVIKSFPQVGILIQRIKEESRQGILLQENKKKQNTQTHESAWSDEDLLQDSPYLDQRRRQFSLAQSQLDSNIKEKLQGDVHKVPDDSLEMSSEQLLQLNDEGVLQEFTPRGDKKIERRLSEIDLSKMLKLTQKRGLKLQWQVDN